MKSHNSEAQGEDRRTALAKLAGLPFAITQATSPSVALAATFAATPSKETVDAMAQKLAARKIGEKVDSLRSGVFPLTVGLGTVKDNNPRLCVRTALELGYRLFDTAQKGSDEPSVANAIGTAISAKLISRKDVFITTKIWSDKLGYRKTVEAVRDSVMSLGIQIPGSFTKNDDGTMIQGLQGGADLVLVNWPGEFIRLNEDDNDDQAIEARGQRRETWEALQFLQNNGLVNLIGVSNYGVRHLKELLKYAETYPAVNQIEIHPYNQREELVKLCQSNGIAVNAYSPLGGKGGKDREAQVTDELLKDPVLTKIADSYSKTVAQVILRWHLQRGITPIPKASSRGHIGENAEVYDFALTDEDMSAIKGLERGKFVILDDEKLA
jgi:diketogulonate reductase-like aldo/keto reductase